MCINLYKLGASYYNFISKFNNKYGDIKYYYYLTNDIEKKKLIEIYNDKNITIDKIKNIK